MELLRGPGAEEDYTRDEERRKREIGFVQKD
jgi:hypothetical protein